MKELTVEVQNIIAPPKTKSPAPAIQKVKKEETASPVSPVSSEKKFTIEGTEQAVETEAAGYDRSEEGSVKSTTDSPAGRRSLDGASRLFHSPRFSQNGNSPRLKEEPLRYPTCSYLCVLFLRFSLF